MLPKTESVVAQGAWPRAALVSSTALDWLDQDHDGSSPERALEIVIPFTTLEHAQRSIQRAEWLCSGLNASLRIVRVLPAPYPLDLDHPCISEAAARTELGRLTSELPMVRDLWFSRDWMQGFLSALARPSLVILTCRRSLFPTREQRIAKALKKAGHRVSMFQEDSNRA